MPETAKVSGREVAPSKTEEPGIGAAKVVKHSIESSSFEVHTASPESEKGPQEPEGSDELEPEVPDEKDAHADTIADAPKDAVETEEKEPLDEGGGSSDDGNEEGFFSGWDGFDDIHELSAEQELVDEEELVNEHEQFEGLGGHHTLSEIALASGSLRTLESDTGPDVSSKHDELAEAVQAALMSVYGDAPSAVAARRSLPSPDLHATGPGWASEDNLSPQDVILNYFDYQAASGKSRRSLSDDGDAGYRRDTSNGFAQSQDHPSSRYQAQWPSSPPEQPEYDDLPAYPVAEAYAVPPRAAEAAERESSRLLGAAAIGLVGGIAIAASLAVFVINSYGPGGRTAGASTPTTDTSQPGYGRWVKSNAELETSKLAVAPSAEAAPVIAASDVLVMSGQPSPLAIDVKPEQANERILISITGIPEGARLNAGVDAGGGNWLLPPRRLNGLTINVPTGTPDTVLMDVQVLDSNVRTPLSDKKQFAIRVNTPKTEPAVSTTVPPAAQPQIAALQRTQPEPVAMPEAPKPAKPAPSFFSTETVPTSASAVTAQAEPPAKPATPTGVGQQATLTRQAALQAPGSPADQPKAASRTEIEDLIRDGNKRMKEGDILEARRLYQKAVGLGDPEAALAMGRSYDPIYFARIDKKNAEADAAKAFDWYRKAMDGGAAQTAKVRIENLKHFLNQ